MIDYCSFDSCSRRVVTWRIGACLDDFDFGGMTIDCNQTLSYHCAALEMTNVDPKLHVSSGSDLDYMHPL